MSISGIEWLIIVVAALLLFGPSKLPELGRAVGKTMREFKKATNSMIEEDSSDYETKEKTVK